jgi:hypothetical protein
MNNEKIARELLKLAKTLTAATPKINQSKTVKVNQIAKDEETAKKQAVQRLTAYIKLMMDKELQKRNLGGWYTEWVDVKAGKVKDAGRSGNDLQIWTVTLKVKMTVSFSHSERINDLSKAVIDNAANQFDR